MNKNLKSGLLLFLLVGPLLFFGFFHLFGTNSYNIPIYYPTGINESGDTIYHKVPDFSFTDQYGEEVTLEKFKNKLFVVDFFFVKCPTVCPKISSSMAYLQKSFKNHDDVLFLSHTVDPVHDTIPILKEYAELYGAKKDVWHFVTGDKEKLYTQAKEGYKLLAAENDHFTHSEKLVLVDKNLNIRGYYNGTDEKEVEKFIKRN